MKPTGVAELIARYDVPGPRYTSYPTALQFNDSFCEDTYFQQAIISNQIAKPLSLYVHIPFCKSLCYYCACTKIITQHPETAGPYLDDLLREAQLVSQQFHSRRQIAQLHLGGGTPTFLTDAELKQLVNGLNELFTFSIHCEKSIEIDPRTVDAQRIALLAKMGFNRLSLGIQDFDPRVQQAVNRIQSPAITIALMEAARKLGIQSISVDLIYGLPHQTARSFDHTLDTILDASPDRISLYSYAHLPNRFKAQRLIQTSDLPTAKTKIGLLTHSIEKLTKAGYVYIGMDHFARANDELALAQKTGNLHRNFQGYSTHAECDLLGLGLTAISRFGDCLSQNVKKTKAYAQALDSGHLPIERGLILNDDDKLRAAVIQAIMCRGQVDFDSFDQQFGSQFQRNFSDELKRLRNLERDGLVTIDEQGFVVTDAGRLLLRAIAMTFDRYLQKPAHTQRFSKVI